MSKTKKASGLSISRNWEDFTFKWKIPKGGYGDGQGMQVAYHGGDYKKVTVGKTTTSKKITIARSNFWPYSGKKTTASIAFRVHGNKKGSGTSMSKWEDKSFPISLPEKPTLSQESTWPSTKFSWSVETAADNSAWFTQVRYQTVLLQNSSETDGTKITGWTGETTSQYASSSKTYIEDSSKINDGNSYTRWFRVRAEGPRGYTDWVYGRKLYANSNAFTVTNYKITETTTGYNMTLYFSSPISGYKPTDKAVIEYAIDTPDANMECPIGASWSQGTEVTAKNGTSGALFGIDNQITDDKCLWIRVNSQYDNRVTYGEPYLIAFGENKDYYGSLSAPTITDVDFNPDTNRVDISATNNSSVPDSFMVVRYMSDDNPNGIDVAIIPHGQTTASGVQCPAGDASPRFGVYAAAPGGCYEETPRADGVGSYAVTPKMASSVTTSGGAIPSAPENVTATASMPGGTIRVTWEWSWADADSAELSWADHEDAWESTNEPTVYTISKRYASAWNISGLETGKKWYVRVRLVDTVGEANTYGAYSDAVEVDLSSAPLVPVIRLSDSVITEDGQVTASWVYSTTDGTGQSGAVIAEVTQEFILDYELTSDVTVDDTKTYYTRTGAGTEEDPYIYTEVENPVDADLGLYYEIVGSTPGDFIYTPIAQTQTAQYITLSAEEYGWQTGETHLLAVRTTSGSGHDSDEYSDPESVTIAEPPTCTITATSLDTVTFTTTDEEGNPVTESVTALTELPLTVTVTGAGESGVTRLAIERFESYHVDRPDETDRNGFEGETIAIPEPITGEGTFTIDTGDLIGHLDDGANYKIIATVQDGLGQSAEASIVFAVLWAHQASAPTATVTIDPTEMIAVMTPTAPADADPTDVCDIYRLSIDRPQLVYQGASFGTTYIDPFPAIGQYGGYRFVTRTKNDDVTTPDGSFAWEDIPAELRTRYNVFDFADGRVLLELDVEISNQWKKDFKETQYLGGSVQGDWNKAISRTASVSGVAIPGRDDDLIQAMRRLADNAGICHVRTKDGSSYAADVQVGDKYNYSSGVKTYEYTMTITRVEPEELDGMTLAEWQDVNEESE